MSVDLSWFYIMNFAPGAKLKIETLPDECPKTIIPFQVAWQEARYSGDSQIIFDIPSTTHSPITRKVSSFLSGEMATDGTHLEWPSSVWSGAPVAASQSRTVLSCDPDTTCLLSGEKATDETQSEWPSSVCRAAFQCASIFGVLWIQGGIHFLKCIRIILLFGAKTRAEQYNCSGVFSINDW